MSRVKTVPEKCKHEVLNMYLVDKVSVEGCRDHCVEKYGINYVEVRTMRNWLKRWEKECSNVLAEYDDELVVKTGMLLNDRIMKLSDIREIVGAQLTDKLRTCPLEDMAVKDLFEIYMKTENRLAQMLGLEEVEKETTHLSLIFQQINEGKERSKLIPDAVEMADEIH